MGRRGQLFVYTSNKEKVREDQCRNWQLERLIGGNKWILGGDFNDIKNPHEKSGGRIRLEISCNGFRQFIERMDIEEVAY